MDDDNQHTPTQLPGHTSDCFGCGPKNDSGLRIEPWRLGDEIYADVTFDERHVGGPGLTHGGAIAAACDEVLGFMVWVIGAPAVTRSLTVDYLAPMPLGETVRITARMDGEKGRAIFLSATGKRGDTTVFTANGVYVRVSFEHFAPHGELETAEDELREQLARESGH